MIRVSGFGQTGPYAARDPGFGAIGEAMGGLRYVVGDPVDAAVAGWASASATRWPRPSPASARCRRCTTASARAAARWSTRAIYEAVLAMMESLITEYDQAGYIRERTGAILPNVAPSNVYPTSDGAWC